MKTITRNIFLSGCLFIGTASLIHAQQAPAAATVITGNQVTTVNGLAPVAAFGQSSGSGYSYTTGNYEKSYKDADLKSKEVSKEITVSKTADIYIENASRGIVVKTWDQPKVKVTTTIYYDGETKLTDDEWLEKVNLSLKTLGASVKIKSGSIGGNGSSFTFPSTGTVYSSGGSGSSSGVAVFNGNGQNIGTKSDLKRTVTITVPAGSKLDIESKYSDVTLPASIGDVNIEITNGNLEAENLGKMILRSKYSNVNVGDIKTAEVEFSNGRFTAKTIDDLDIESKNATVEMAAVKKLVLRSTNDEFELEEAGEIRGKKTYGNLRITKLNNSIELDGSNANVKVRKVGPALSLVKIDNKYADIRVPLRETKNYSVDFAGSYSSVYGNFEKKPVAEKEASKGTLSQTAPMAQSKMLYSNGSGVWDTNSSNSAPFTATVGDGKGLKVEIKCPNCTVDFK